MLKKFDFIDIWFEKQDIKNEKKKDKIFLTFRSKDSNPRLSVMFVPLIWISQQFDGDGSEPKNVSKTALCKVADATLKMIWPHY